MNIRLGDGLYYRIGGAMLGGVMLTGTAFGVCWQAVSLLVG